MLTDSERQFVEARKVAHLATADRQAVPHVVPVCFAISVVSLYIAIDGKPKRGSPTKLKRLRNIAENPSVAVVIDHYDEDWTRLGWVMIRGRAEVLLDGPEKVDALGLLRARYVQYSTMALEGSPLIALRMEHTTSWGRLI